MVGGIKGGQSAIFADDIIRTNCSGGISRLPLAPKAEKTGKTSSFDAFVFTQRKTFLVFTSAENLKLKAFKAEDKRRLMSGRPQARELVSCLATQ